MPLESTGFGRTVRSWNLSRSHTKKTVTRRTRRDARRMEATLPNGGDNAEEEAATSAAAAADVMAERKRGQNSAEIGRNLEFVFGFNVE